jgi:UDP-N-acetylglucosamine 2-epimerase
MKKIMLIFGTRPKAIKMKIKGLSAKTLWDNQFNNATVHFFENIYSKIINI